MTISPVPKEDLNDAITNSILLIMSRSIRCCHSLHSLSHTHTHLNTSNYPMHNAPSAAYLILHNKPQKNVYNKNNYFKYPPPQELIIQLCYTLIKTVRRKGWVMKLSNLNFTNCTCSHTIILTIKSHAANYFSKMAWSQLLLYPHLFLMFPIF